MDSGPTSDQVWRTRDNESQLRVNGLFDTSYMIIMRLRLAEVNYVTGLDFKVKQTRKSFELCSSDGLGPSSCYN